ncbi:hypothetical protein [Pararhodobacter marinus]|uniref:Uncharacterized protein n=1 Tax=Pararhodobacter marinus TaxID=2184063 RepID=A0A2U2C988_9RHOB|nr:hypothetical protein [Pararhodobacter marinus]PWE28458.1 hypothetical protein C4N9_10685 [Pararhodobacter marinus]
MERRKGQSDPDEERARAERARRLGQGARVPVQAQFDGAVWEITHLVMTDGESALSLDWEGPLLLHDEERADLSELGPAAGLFRQPFKARWAEGVHIGFSRIAPSARTLIALVGDLRGLAGRSVTLSCDGVGWDLPGRLAPGGLPVDPVRDEEARMAGGVKLGADGRVLMSFLRVYRMR